MAEQNFSLVKYVNLQIRHEMAGHSNQLTGVGRSSGENFRRPQYVAALNISAIKHQLEISQVKHQWGITPVKHQW